jgi:hypothetical protein
MQILTASDDQVTANVLVFSAIGYTGIYIFEAWAKWFDPVALARGRLDEAERTKII